MPSNPIYEFADDGCSIRISSIKRRIKIDTISLDFDTIEAFVIENRVELNINKTQKCWLSHEISHIGSSLSGVCHMCASAWRYRCCQQDVVV